VLTPPINGPRPADEKAPRKRRGVGRPKKSVSGELVPKEHAMRDRFLVSPARPGKIVSARLVYKNKYYRLLVTLSWKQGEFTVTGYDSYEVREWSSADQALKRLYESYDFAGTAVVERERENS
jgi:hypothetical protein